MMSRRAVLYALASAVLFGASTPVAKILLGGIDPAVLAGLLYCGAGIGIAFLRRITPTTAFHASDAPQVPLQRRDVPWLAAAIIAGGVAGPLLLMVGLTRTDAATASLLLTLEGAATALLAWFVFRENFDRRIALGMICLVAGAIVLSWSGTPSIHNVLGPLAILCACVAWGLDNNLTRKVSLADPLQIAELKGLVAGPINIAIGVWAGGSISLSFASLFAGVTGFLGYGVSLALYILALRDLGAARTSAYFSTAPFAGALIAVIALGENVTIGILIAGVLMGVGVWLHVTERHEHEHLHEPAEHAHPHVHDAHHQHAHAADDPPGEPHTHRHRHGALRHAHPHVPDMHHQHRH
jgi:drug/metabolite transporter (DMT)-like permease